ncbi:response regulator transcription factor [Clostridium lacusfryxellense]|uniref:response regulator transcription factor n=1 Tax=Clostridium lacusfryxellense TaxID=205328 RepID=UPI001C0B80F2|nr:response regulator [Clostridium lacusfryxellense]MBU3114047.1 response regulator [Clostridium lacusfryxellense]
MLLAKNYKVIVVEDEALIRRSISKKIQTLNLGFDVVGSAMDGQSALTLIESELPHLVVTDIRMPIMNGLELIKNIYFTYPSIKVIILSGFNEFEFARQAIQYGVNDYLLKPVTTEQLSESLTKIKLKLDSNLTSLLTLANSKSQNVKPDELVKTVELYIRTNYKNDLTLEDIAKSLNFSSDYLSRIYKKSTGKSPLKYLIHLRINEAKRLLTTNLDLDIKTVGELVGYSDQYYFSRTFKQHTNHYPSEYRSLKEEEN